MNLKKIAAFVLSLLVIGSLFVCLDWLMRKHAAAQRQAVYQAALKSYRTDFPLGMNRGAVESKLHSRGAQFRKICCEIGAYAYSDEVLIGHEPKPWYCSYNNVYISFQFDGRYHDLAEKDPIDTLKATTIVHRLEECL